MDSAFWRGKKVFLTGHTGFKGSWLSLWLQQAGAEVAGYALSPPTQPSLFEVAGVTKGMRSIIADVRDLDALKKAVDQCKPEVVIHMAAQPIVLYSYDHPVETYATNVMGTVNVLEAVRVVDSVRAVLIVTSDKCYENKEWVWGYREDEPMGGYDPYSNSKGCAELVTAAYRNSFFPAERYAQHGVAIASARAGNVIGGGDWADYRLIPDMMKAVMAKRPLVVRNPHAIRPWQHVLEPLHGYLCLAEKLVQDGPEYCGGWNFGPREHDAQDVQHIVETVARQWGEGATWQLDGKTYPHEANYLKLDCSKAKALLGWSPKTTVALALEWIVEWFKAYEAGADMHAVTLAQIARFDNLDKG